MQRIFYEIYRDRAAFDSHESQPYMQRFVAERRSCVLATNVIELRLKYAKVAPLPNPQAPAAAAPRRCPRRCPRRLRRPARRPARRSDRSRSRPARRPAPAGRRSPSGLSRCPRAARSATTSSAPTSSAPTSSVTTKNVTTSSVLARSVTTSGGPNSGRCRQRAGVTAVSVPRITLLGRPGCHLCDDARAVIERVAADLGVGWEERDITASPDDMREYWDKIPVTLVDGVQIDFWRVSEARLRAALG